MEETMSIGQIEQKKIEDINAMLPKLWQKGLLTDIECRLIVSSKNILENKGRRKGAVYKVIRSKTKEEAAILTEAFGTKPLAIHVKANSRIVQTTYSVEEINNSIFLQSKNPFLNNTIIMHLFGFLPLKDMKESRLVCREWNSTAEICLRKRSLIRFYHNSGDDLLPNTFIEMSKYSLPDLPFPSFKFFCHPQSLISDIQDFFVKWGKNIKEVSFYLATFARKCNLTNKEVLISDYNLNLLFINPSNITCLKIQYRGFFKPKTKFEISLETFVSIKTLSLSKCRIIVPAENQTTHIAPVNIHFEDISVIRNGEISTHIQYNDFVDFSNAVDVYLTQMYDNSATLLDMSHHVFNVNKLSLVFNVSLTNLAQAKGDVQHLELRRTPFVEKTPLKVKELEACGSEINLSALPQTLELLEWSSCEIFCSEPFELPNLKYLYINVNDIYNLEFFSNCANLEELAIEYEYSIDPCTERVSLYRLPKNIKRMSLQLCKEQFVDSYPVELDSLNLYCLYGLTNVTDCLLITAQIKAKVLVVFFHRNTDINTSDIVKLVMANQQSEKILIGSGGDLHEKTPFKGSGLSKCVDTKSNFYQFENQVGKSITVEEFEIYADVEKFI